MRHVAVDGCTCTWLHTGNYQTAHNRSNHVGSERRAGACHEEGGRICSDWHNCICLWRMKNVSELNQGTKTSPPLSVRTYRSSGSTDMVLVQVGVETSPCSVCLMVVNTLPWGVRIEIKRFRSTPVHILLVLSLNCIMQYRIFRFQHLWQNFHKIYIDQSLIVLVSCRLQFLDELQCLRFRQK